MRKYFIGLTFAAAFLSVGNSFAGETYESEEAKFKITFPTEYEVETETEDGTTTISLSCVYGNMILLGHAYIFEDEVSEDDNDLTELTATINVCNAFETKWKDKNVFLWDVDGDHGWGHPLKTKLAGDKYYGNYYVIIQGNLQWQFTFFCNDKKYDTSIENKFIDSFQILD